jgi:hypothetical protein
VPVLFAQARTADEALVCAASSVGGIKLPSIRPILEQEAVVQPNQDRVHARHGKKEWLCPAADVPGKRTADCAAMQCWCLVRVQGRDKGWTSKLAKLICRRDRPASVVYGLKCEENRLKTPTHPPGQPNTSHFRRNLLPTNGDRL